MQPPVLHQNRFSLQALIGCLSAFILFSLIPVLVSAEEATTAVEDHLKRAESYLRQGHEFHAVNEFRQAIEKNPNRSEVYGYLSILLYEMGFIDDAIREMRNAVALSPDSVYLNMELGKFYFSSNSFGDAMERFFSVLEMNPGHTNAYYYLGELFLRMKEYNMAWLAARMARRMGHRGQDLIGKLRDLSDDPSIDVWKKPGPDLYLRQILLDTREQAEDLARRISGGELFEDIAGKEFAGPAADLGGFIGSFDPKDVHPRISEKLLQEDALSGPFVIETDKGFHVVQRLVPFDYSLWEDLVAEYISNGGTSGDRDKAEYSGSKGRYLVYVGAFRSQKSAEARVTDLQELGFPSYQYQKGLWFNVVAGRYRNYKEALEAGRKIADHGYEYYIPRKR